jgi:lipopolysaccharide transport system permease protein
MTRTPAPVDVDVVRAPLRDEQPGRDLAANSPVINIEPSASWFSLGLGELWAYRELLYFLIWRDVKVRYKQTAVGAAWAILQPVLTMMMFTLVFKRIANVSSDGFPYPIFAFAALLPWSLFAGAVTRNIVSVVAEAHLISKVYFPRLIVPVAATLSGLVDFGMAFLVLLALMGWYGIAPTIQIATLPAFLLLALTTALAVGLWLSALNVRYRDVGHTVPFLVQMWMFASPVAYSASVIPDNWRWLYSLNPLAGVIEGFRWALLGVDRPDLQVIAISATVVVALLVSGSIYFKRMERTFADVV